MRGTFLRAVQTAPHQYTARASGNGGKLFEDQSGDKNRLGHITREGATVVRQAGQHERQELPPVSLSLSNREGKDVQAVQSRSGRERSRLASASPTNSSLTGSNFSLRLR